MIWWAQLRYNRSQVLKLKKTKKFSIRSTLQSKGMDLKTCHWSGCSENVVTSPATFIHSQHHTLASMVHLIPIFFLCFLKRIWENVSLPSIRLLQSCKVIFYSSIRWATGVSVVIVTFNNVISFYQGSDFQLCLDSIVFCWKQWLLSVESTTVAVIRLSLAWSLLFGTDGLSGLSYNPKH